MEREQTHGSCSLLFPRCSVEELWATSLWLQRGKASGGVTEQSWCPVLRLCRNREVTLSLCSHVRNADQHKLWISLYLRVSDVNADAAFPL